MRIVVVGYIVRHPLGGMAWSNLQYLLGLKDLGYDVFFIEDSEDYPDCYDPVRNTIDTDSQYGLRFAADVMRSIGFEDRWSYYDAHRTQWLGPCADRALQICEGADVLLNLCGVNPLRPWLQGIPRKILVDEDPGFTQVRNVQDPERLHYVKQHDSFFTFAENIGERRCRIPDDGIDWKATRQPVVLRALAPLPPNPSGHFSTVMYWQSTRAPRHNGIVYGMKAESFGPFVELPQRSSERFQLAVGGANAPLDWLLEHGWVLADPREQTASLSRYLEFTGGSKAEFSVAKHGYVVSRGGWFSERSTTYLAMGRPVVVQDTGFTAWLPVGEGVMAFDSIEQAVDAVHQVSARYEMHCKAARAIVEEYFDSNHILSNLLDTALNMY